MGNFELPDGGGGDEIFFQALVRNFILPDLVGGDYFWGKVAHTR